MPDVGSIIAGALLVLAVVIAVVQIRKRIKGEVGCGCGCSGCSASLELLNGSGKELRAEDLPPCCRGHVIEPRIVDK